MPRSIPCKNWFTMGNIVPDGVHGEGGYPQVHGPDPHLARDDGA